MKEVSGRLTSVPTAELTGISDTKPPHPLTSHNTVCYAVIRVKKGSQTKMSNDLSDELIMAKASKYAVKAIIRVVDKYKDSTIDITNKDTREAMAEMFQEGVKYAYELAKETL